MFTKGGFTTNYYIHQARTLFYINFGFSVYAMDFDLNKLIV